MEPEMRKSMKKNDPFIGKYVIVRAFGAGVHCGVLASRDRDCVELAESRHLWSWVGAPGTHVPTLYEVASIGPDPKESRLSIEAERVALTGAMEIIPASTAAESILRTAKWAR